MRLEGKESKVSLRFGVLSPRKLVASSKIDNLDKRVHFQGGGNEFMFFELVATWKCLARSLGNDTENAK